MILLKEGAEVREKDGMIYLVERGKIKKYKPWLGDRLSFLYDFFMDKSIFPKKFQASLQKHNGILKEIYGKIHGMDVLELASGSGVLAAQLPNDNSYTGMDISEGLLKKAAGRFRGAGFTEADFVLCSVDGMPFGDGCCDICICNLSLNFFPDLPDTVKEIWRMLRPGGVFFCSVPVPERIEGENTIRGRLYSKAELQDVLEGEGFSFESCGKRNGALLYFRACRQKV